MHELNELLQWCVSNKAWLTVNYSPFSDGYKVFVNPGRSMTSAKWFKTLDEAVKACWAALGINTMPKNIQKFHEKAEEIFKDSPTGVVVSAIVPLGEMEKMFEQVSISGKRRGRPKGSKNKPKVVANE